MATNPIDRNEDDLSRDSLREKLARISPGVSPEARVVLEAALAEQPEPSLFAVLAAMPNVGLDSDFERHPR
jgi:hypothetical protein